MKQHTITGIDIGSSTVRCVIAHVDGESNALRIIGVGTAPTEGMRRGAVADIALVAQALNDAVEKAELMAGAHVKSAIVSIGGSGVTIQEVKGVVAIGRADGEVTDDDVMRAITAAQTFAVPTNQEIIHVVPKSFRLDDQENISNPVGLKGVRLEVQAHVIEAPGTHVKNITAVMDRANIAIEEFVIEPLAAAEAVLSAKQKELGVAVVVLGAHTTSVAIFEEGDLLHTAIIPVGSAFITNDLAIGMRTSIDVAEQVKLMYGSAEYGTVKRTDEIDLATFDPHEEGAVLHDHVIEIVLARLEEIFSLVREEFKRVEKDQLLPAGVVLTGGGANLVHTVHFAKEALQLPVHIGHVDGMLGVMDHVDDPSYSTVLGLLLWQETYGHQGASTQKWQTMFSGLFEGTVGVGKRLKELFQRFLP